MPSEREFIAHFRSMVERKLQLGDSGGRLKQRDFEYLTKLIEEKSKVRLSLSTLKRFWKDDFTQEPHPATLDALASILDFDSWQSYKKRQSELETPTTRTANRQQRSSIVLPVAGALVAVLALVVFLVIQGFNRSEKKMVLPDSIVFKADKTITSGVPNTVLFTYDVKNVKADSFFIQQSWNPLDKVKIDPNKNYFSSIYYTPGFHRAKLIANDTIIRTARIHIKTDGWMPVAQYDIADNSPYYLETKDMFLNGIMHATPESFESAGIDMSQKFLLRYYNIREFEGIDSDNFSIEAQFKNDSAGNALCPMAELTILTEEHIYFVPITSMGCVGELQLKIGEVYMNSRDSNLSGLGTNVDEWQKLRIENRNKSAVVFLNDKEAIKIRYHRDFGKIVGLIFTFNGSGSVDYINVKDLNGDTVYSDDFGQPQ